jgi:competence protein ComEC
MAERMNPIRTLRIRPITALLLVYVLGILLAPVLPLTPAFYYLLAALCVAAGISISAPPARMALLLLPFMFLGVGRMRDTSVPHRDDIVRFAGRPSVWVLGTVTSLAEETASDGYRFMLTAIQVNDYRTVYSASGKVSITLRQGPPPPMGEQLWLRGRITLIQAATNPGAFDYQAFLARHGTFCQMIVRYPDDRYRAKSSGPSLLTIAQGIRQWVQTQTAQHLPPADAALLNGILLSVRSHLSASLDDAFQRTGTVHILSVSGLHMTAFAGVLVFAFRYLLLPRSLTNLLSIALIWLFALAAGASAAPVRAAVMATVWLAAPLVRRTAEPLHSLAFAALILLFADPGSLFDAGFQLSFASVGGLLLFMEPLSERFLPQKRAESRSQRFSRWVLLALLVGIVAEAVTAPLVAYHFNQWSLISPFTNVLIAVWSEWLLLLGLLVVGVSPLVTWLPPIVTTVLWMPLTGGLSVMRWMAYAFAALPFASVNVVSPPVWFLCLYYVCLVCCAIAVRRLLYARRR